jgi:hypothetical protein
MTQCMQFSTAQRSRIIDPITLASKTSEVMQKRVSCVILPPAYRSSLETIGFLLGGEHADILAQRSLIVLKRDDVIGFCR